MSPVSANGGHLSRGDGPSAEDAWVDGLQAAGGGERARDQEPGTWRMGPAARSPQPVVIGRFGRGVSWFLRWGPPLRALNLPLQLTLSPPLPLALPLAFAAELKP